MSLSLLAFLALSSEVEHTGVTQPLSCVNYLDMKPAGTGAAIIIVSKTHEPRLESFHVYSDGYVTYSVQLRFGEVVDCRARLDPQRVARLKADLLRTKVWLIEPEKRVPSRKNASLVLDLGMSQRCQLQMSSSRWLKTPGTREVQKVVDALKRDVCDGACPEPEQGHYPRTDR
jgi:hypothetical protein